jgi:signal transduction histidine kinase
MLVRSLSDSTTQRIGFGLMTAAGLLLVADTARAVSQGRGADIVENVLLGTTFLSVLAISMRAQPRNPAVWTLLWAAIFGLLSQVGGNVGESLSDITQVGIDSGEVTASPSSIEPLAALGFAFGLTLWVPGAFLLAIHLLILFPNGDGVSPRWRRVLWVTGIVMGVAVIVGIALLGPWVDQPYDEGLGIAIAFGPTPLLMLVAAAAVVHLIRRYRASSGEERLQYRWVTWALSIFVLNIFTFGLIPDPFGVIFSTASLANIAVAFGIAITRYRLYNIDLVVSRSVTFGALAVFIAGLYVAIVVGLGELLGGGAPFSLQIIASVLIAMVFQPVRRGVQRWANRLVYGERASPYEVLVRFSRRSAELSDEELLLRIPRLIVDGTGAETAWLWIRSDDGFRTAASSPDHIESRHLDGVAEFADLEADHSVPVLHHGEFLGGLSLVKVGGETVTAAEEALLADLASGMGLALRNARLTGRLRAQVAELEASRERVLAAADAARRTLENDLDSGPQQALVAVKVKLGPTRKRAELAGAEKLAGFLTQLEADAGEAIRAVRDFAGGIYPPLLEAEGLVTAIGQQAQKSAVPVSVRGGSVGRYPREVEAAVYFSVLEALQNTAKYAEASSVSVTLAESNASLTFEVRDDGCGFDSAATTDGAGLTGMADRLDTVGGTLTITSAPGQGTLITGTVPVSELMPA